MRYYVTTDVHGFYTPLRTALTEVGFFTDPEPHKLIICGDLFDRGTEALQLQKFLLELQEKEQLIMIRGNHEDLAMQLLQTWHRGSYYQPHHHHNGTVDTFCQLTGISHRTLMAAPEAAAHRFLKTPYVQELIPAMVDYFETAGYIFVHGWIPCIPTSIASGQMAYTPIPHWRQADPGLWAKARWINGIEAAHHGITEPGKTIVCGHWHTSFGHCHYEGDGGEWKDAPNFSPFHAPGLIALDACTSFSKKINCIVIDDEKHPTDTATA